jgi:hypothetical protein
MADVLRSCSKTACRWPAAASLSYRYATRQVWLLDLAPSSDPSLYDLCPHHADALVVPQGWERVDDRTVQEVMVEPSADDRAAAATRRTATAADLEPVGALTSMTAPASQAPAGAGRNRYADLVAQLPKLAEQVSGPQPPATATIRSADHEAGPPDAGEPALAPARIAAAPPQEAPSRPVLPAVPARPTAPVPSRELAPIPPTEAAWNADAIEPPLPTQALPPQPLPGQLAIPVDDLTDGEQGVVLQFELAGSRRRTRS